MKDNLTGAMKAAGDKWTSFAVRPLASNQILLIVQPNLGAHLISEHLTRF